MQQAVQSLIDSGGNTTILVYSGAAFLALATIMMDKHDSLENNVFISFNRDIQKILTFSMGVPPINSLICRNISMLGFGILSISPFLFMHIALIKKIFISQWEIKDICGYPIGFYFEDILVCSMLILTVCLFVAGILIGIASLRDGPIADRQQQPKN